MKKNMKLGVYPPEVTRFSIETVLQAVFMVVGSDPQFRLKFPEFAAFSPQITKAMKQARIRTQFLAFCRDGNITPRKKDDPAACFKCDGDVEQEKEFDISLEEFRLFARSYGFDVSNEEKDSLSYWSNKLNEEATFLKPTSIRLSPGIPLLSPSGAEIEEPWNDPEIEEALKADADKKKRTLKQQIPGKLPRKSIGKLAVKIAWGVEVDTGKRVGARIIMAHLCKLATADSDKDCLLDADTSIPGQEQVKWTDEGTENWFSLEDCKSCLRTWRNSIPQKRGLR